MVGDRGIEPRTSSLSRLKPEIVSTIFRVASRTRLRLTFSKYLSYAQGFRRDKSVTACLESIGGRPWNRTTDLVIISDAL